VSPLSFIAMVETVIKPPIVVKSIEWSVDEKSGPKPRSTAALLLQFPGVPDLDAWRVVSKKIIADLKAVFTRHDIAFSKLPPRFSETEKMDVSFDGGGPAQESRPAAGSSDVLLTIKEL
jgi:hypothetical protein